jgi:PAS domain S-box-containing protein
MVDASRDAVVVFCTDGRVVSVNSRGRELLNADPSGDLWTDLWPSVLHDEVERAAKTALEGRQARFRAFLTRPEAPARWLDTFVLPVHEGGVVKALIATSRDVTAEIETQSFLDNIVEYVPAGLFAMDAGDGRYVMLNLAAEDMMGLPREEVLGRTSLELFSEDYGGGIRARIEEVVASGRVRVYEDRVETEQGVQFLRVRMMATYGDEGARHVIGITEDITEQHRADEALKQAAERAEAANRSKSEFLANMSHEIRTPLNGVVGVADVLARTELSAGQRDMVEIIRSSGVTLERLLSDVLDLARIESGHLEIEHVPFHLGDAARAITGLLAMRAQEKGVSLNLELAPEAEGRVVGDVVRVKQILTNLLSNAVKFTERGEVRLCVSYLGGEDRRFRFDVKDTGVGFDASQKDRVFARFQQADGSITRRFGGTGLGLAISRQLSHLMGGGLDCESTPGVGSTFSVELPMPEAAADARAPDQPQFVDGARCDAQGAGRALRVLLADDHPINRKVVELILGQVGIELASVEDGLQAVEAFKSGAFDVVLMDMQMPGMDGLTATRTIRDWERAHGLAPTPVFMLTANALAEHLEASRSSGADRHLTKPITADKLLGALVDIEPREETPSTAFQGEPVIARATA